jgi:hypothetical protein
MTVLNRDITIESALPVVSSNGLKTMTNIDFDSGSNSCALPASTTIGGSAVVALGDITSSATTGNMFTVTNTGVYTGTGVTRIIANSATTGSLLTVTGNGLTTGNALVVSSSGIIATSGNLVSLAATGLTTGTALNMGALEALTTGVGIKIAHTTSVIADGGSLLRLSSSSTDTGGATNGTLVDVKSTAQLAGTIVRLDNILTTGTAMSIIGTGVMTTTGNLLTITGNSATTAAGLLRVNANGLTTGNAVAIASSSADTSARNLVSISNSGTASVGTVPLTITNNAVTGTGSKFVKILSGSQTSKTVTIWMSIDATSPDTNLSGTAGDICLNGPSNRMFYCTGTTNWTASNA